MNAYELKLATAIAQDSSVDLSADDDTSLFGFGLANFQPVTVSIRAVAKCMRWQCSYVIRKEGDPAWNWDQYNEDLPFYRRNVHIADLTDADARAWILAFVTARIEPTNKAALI